MPWRSPAPGMGGISSRSSTSPAQGTVLWPHAWVSRKANDCGRRQAPANTTSPSPSRSGSHTTTPPPAAIWATALSTPTRPSRRPAQGSEPTTEARATVGADDHCRAITPTTSASRFTRRPSSRDPSVVSASVVGISATEKRSRTTSATVRLTPSTATEPLATISARNRWGGRIHTRRPPPSSRPPATLPTASTWPCTRCPSSGSPARSGSSRLTRSAGRHSPATDRRRVSPTISARKPPSLMSVAVRHTPDTATEPPGCNPAAVLGAATATPSVSISTMAPISLIRPVNTMVTSTLAARGSTTGRGGRAAVLGGAGCTAWPRSSTGSSRQRQDRRAVTAAPGSCATPTLPRGQPPGVPRSPRQ